MCDRVYGNGTSIAGFNRVSAGMVGESDLTVISAEIRTRCQAMGDAATRFRPSSGMREPGVVTLFVALGFEGLEEFA